MPKTSDKYNADEALEDAIESSEDARAWIAEFEDDMNALECAETLEDAIANLKHAEKAARDFAEYLRAAWETASRVKPEAKAEA